MKDMELLKEALSRDTGNDAKNKRNADIIKHYDAAISEGKEIYCFVSPELADNLGLGRSNT